ncbi:MAG: RecX family transcriptional regulator, partial [Bacteroidia bacterium]|nr:RecX family transcriptional regulator [Bacteroidia bacterium]
MGIIQNQSVIMTTDEKNIHEVYNRLAALCSRSEQCSPDIRKKIVALGFEDETAAEITAKLKEENFFDDERFIRSFVADKFKFNKWGKVKIRYYLKMKGLPGDLIENGLNSIDEDLYKQLLIKILKEKAKTIKKKDKFEKMGQLIRFAQGRGFEPEII